MQWSDIPFRPATRTLRQFAGLWILFFSFGAVWQALVRGHNTAAVVLGLLAIIVGPVGLAWPRLIRPIFVGWMVLVFPIGWVVSKAMLAVLFYGLFTPIGLLFRQLGRDPLARRRRPELQSYWAPKALPDDPKRYLRQF